MSKQQGTSGRPRGPMNAPSNVTAAAVAAAAGKCQLFYKSKCIRMQLLKSDNSDYMP